MKKIISYLIFGLFVFIVPEEGLATGGRTGATPSSSPGPALNQPGADPSAGGQTPQVARVYRSYQQNPEEIKKRAQARREEKKKEEPSRPAEPPDWTRDRSYQRSTEAPRPKTTLVHKNSVKSEKTPPENSYGHRPVRRPVASAPEQSLAQTYHPDKVPPSPPARDDGRYDDYQVKPGQSEKKTTIKIASKEELKPPVAVSPQAFAHPGGEGTARVSMPVDKRAYLPGSARKNTYHRRRGPLPAPLEKGPAPVESSSLKTDSSPPPAANPAAPLPPLTAADDLDRSYKAFDHKYTSSLGKSRKELEQLWGFPMDRMGENEREVAYGFRQRGIIQVPEGGPKIVQSSMYMAGDMAKPKNKGKQFACLVILWVDKNGRGVVVDGEAVGDCFSVEDLQTKPTKFER